MTLKIAFLGTGIMGAPMAINVVRGGGDVTVLNRSRVKTQPVADAGAKVADTPGDAVKGADYICSILDAVPLSVRFSSKAARMRK